MRRCPSCGFVADLHSFLVAVHSLKTAFFAVGCLMVISSALQLSLVSEREWSNLFLRVDHAQGNVYRKARSLSFSVKDILKGTPPPRVPKGLSRRASLCSESSTEEESDASFLSDDSSSFSPANDFKKEKAD